MVSNAEWYPFERAIEALSYRPFHEIEGPTKNRELRSLQKAMKELKVDKATIITEDQEGEEKLNGFTVKTVPLWKWLLTEEGVVIS